MKRAILLVLIFSLALPIGGCAYLRELIGVDPLPQQAVCPVLPYYAKPELTSVHGTKIKMDDVVWVGFTQQQMSDLGGNIASLINTIEKYQEAVTAYNAEYTQPTEVAR